MSEAIKDLKDLKEATSDAKAEAAAPAANSEAQEAPSPRVKKVDDLGSFFFQEEGIFFWDQNPWNNFFTYKLDKKKLLLTQRYVLRKKTLNRAISKFFKKSDYYVEENLFKCRILDSWKDIRSLFADKGNFELFYGNADWHLCTNIIHILDLITWLSNEKISKIDGTKLNKKILCL